MHDSRPGHHATTLPRAVHAAQPQKEDHNQPLELVEEALPSDRKIHDITAIDGHVPARNWTRPTHYNKSGAVRMRSFHCRLSEQGLEHLDHSINDWLDRHPDVEVKFSQSTIGLFDGKLKEPALIVNVWY